MSNEIDLNSDLILSVPYPFLPTQEELERIAFQYAVIAQILNGGFLPAMDNVDAMASIDILDCGSGAGTWASEIAFAMPESRVVGFDLFNVPIKYKPANARFVVADANSHPLPFTDGSFDIIHSRNMFMAITNWKGYLKDLSRLLKHNGEIHLIEFSIPKIPSNDSSFDLLRQFIGHFMNDQHLTVYAGHELVQNCKEAGLKVVHTKTYPFAYGDWPDNKHEARIGGLMLSCTRESMDFLSRKYCREFGIDDAQLIAQLDLLFSADRKPMGDVTYVVAKLPP